MNRIHGVNKTVIHEVVKKILHERGMTDEMHMLSFLLPTLAQLPDPFLLKSMDRAVELIVEAVVLQRSILIWGDYDVDGITATALLVNFFHACGITVHYHVPDRLVDGYGLNERSLRTVADSLTPQKILLTVDCGIANHAEVAVARDLGFSVIITDHHLVPEKLPDADAIINPKQVDCQFPYKDLAGVGVAFYLAAALRKKITPELNIANTVCSNINMKQYLDLVCVGTIADVMPLTGVNRILAKGGMETLASAGQTGISILLKELDIVPDAIGGESIAYQVAPVLNAAGRLGQVQASLDLLTPQKNQPLPETARRLANLNMQRKEQAKRDLERALQMTDALVVRKHKCIMINGTFHQGILGITASRLVEMYGVPALVFAADPKDDTVLKGSARSPIGVDLYGVLKKCSTELIAFGGHAMAAGLSVKCSHFKSFCEMFRLAMSQSDFCIQDENKPQNKAIPLCVSEALSPTLLVNLRQLEPYGEGNPRPLFIDQRVILVDLKFFGKTKEHFKAIIRGGYRSNVTLIGYHLGERLRLVDRSQQFTLQYSHMIDSYKGRASWKLKAENIWQENQT